MRFACTLAFLLACGPQVEVPETAGDDDSSGGAPAPDSTTTSVPSTTTTGPSATTIGPVDTTSDDGSDSGSISGFIEDPEVVCVVPPEGTSHHCSYCDTWHQDCARGHACRPWANDGGDVWNITRCSPLDPDAAMVGEPCTVEDNPVSGVDSCIVHAMCWNVDPETLEGECIAFCEGSQNEPICPLDTDCMIANGGVLSLCLPTCDPLAPTACEDGQSCHPVDEAWFCLLDGAGVETATGLMPAHCPSGTTAVDPSLLSSCDPEADVCCAEICDVTTPDCEAPLACTALADGNVGLCLDA